MVVSNNNNSSVTGRKQMVDYRQVAASVVPVPTHVPAPAPVRALSHTNHKQAEPTLLEKERNIPREHDREQVLVARRDESMLVFLKQANTGRDQPIHQPIPRMPEGLGIQINSNEA